MELSSATPSQQRCVIRTAYHEIVLTSKCKSLLHYFKMIMIRDVFVTFLHDLSAFFPFFCLILYVVYPQSFISFILLLIEFGMLFLFRGRLSTDKRSHEMRDSVRESSTISSDIKSSLQPCSNPHLLLRKLSSLEHIHRKSETLVRKLVGLQRVLLELMIPGNTLCSGVDSSTCGGMILFSDAFELFSSYYPQPIDEDHFRDCLLHPEYGLYVCIAYLPNLKKRYLTHNSQSIDVCMLIKCITSTSGDNESISKLNSINKEQVQSILKSMDTEWDKTCARMLFSAGKTNSAINECGI